MAYQNIFSVKRTKPQMSMASGAYKPNNPLDAMGRSAVSGQGISQPPRLSYAQPQQSKAPQMSVAPKLIQGSGYGSQYASNQTNQPVRTPEKTQPAAPVQQAVDPTARYMSDTRTTANSQQQFAENARKQQEDYIKQQYALASQQLGEQLPAAQAQLGQLKANTEASITDLLAGGERQKAQATDYYGEAQREAAKSRREVQGQTQRTFAGLGTLDSRGEGSFAQATENQDSDFNRFTEQTRMAKANKLTEIDMAVKAAERQARATITEEEAKLSELARNIQYAQANNNLQQARELTDAYNTTKQYIYEIEDKVNEMKYQFGLEQQKLDNDMKKTQTFTQGFMDGGKPTNQAEYEFFIKNQKDLQSAYGTDGANSGKQEVVSAIQELLSSPGGLGGVTGYGRLNPANYLPESEAGATRAKLERVKALVSLENASKLKGSGAISDAERALLAAASTAINGNMSSAQVEAELSRIIQQFGGASSSASQTIRVRDNATGQTGTIPANEFNSQQYTRI
jgi:hypothetical protein